MRNLEQIHVKWLACLRAREQCRKKIASLKQKENKEQWELDLIEIERRQFIHFTAWMNAIEWFTGIHSHNTIKK